VGLTSEQSLAIVEQICSALAYAHGKGVVHRDIKPANVMIDTESQVKVADFGLARLTDPSAEQMGHTMTGTVMGTPDYMAPEQMRGMNVDHRADIYSLGVMVYEMFCREVPRGAFEPPSVRIGCDPRIDPIVIRAMQPNPERRYQNTHEMRTDVSAVRQPALAPETEVGTPRRGVQAADAAASAAGGRRGAPSLPAQDVSGF
jgi:serine/threonine protein kinase